MYIAIIISVVFFITILIGFIIACSTKDIEINVFTLLLLFFIFGFFINVIVYLIKVSYNESKKPNKKIRSVSQSNEQRQVIEPKRKANFSEQVANLERLLDRDLITKKEYEEIKKDLIKTHVAKEQ